MGDSFAILLWRYPYCISTVLRESQRDSAISLGQPRTAGIP